MVGDLLQGVLEFTIISQGLASIAQEMGEQLVRSAYSTIIREARDCSTSLLDADGRVIAQAQFCPIHMNSFRSALSGRIALRNSPGR